jgi:hypothetical protein
MLYQIRPKGVADFSDESLGIIVKYAVYIVQETLYYNADPYPESVEYIVAVAEDLMREE